VCSYVASVRFNACNMRRMWRKWLHRGGKLRIFHVPLSLWGVSEYVAEAISRYGSMEHAYDLVIARLENRCENRRRYGKLILVCRWTVRQLDMKQKRRKAGK